MGGRIRVRPSRQRLIADLEALGSVTAVAAKYGVLPCSVSRWKAFYNLPRSVTGVHHWAAKLTAADVRLIRQLRADGMEQAEIAEKFDVCPTVVHNIEHYISYRNV